jgi:hypothetical protein
MSLILIRLLLLSCAVQGAWNLLDVTNDVLERFSGVQSGPKRHLLSTLGNVGRKAAAVGGNLINKDTATYRIQRDWLPLEDVPHPELYYQDLDTGERQLIWAFDDTLPRDVLAGRPDVWLQATLHVEKDVDLLLPFLEHYSKLGIVFERMIFTLIASNLNNKELLYVQKVLRHVGAIFHSLLLVEKEGGISSSFASNCTSKGYRRAVYEANLRATYSVPVKDWIIAVEGNELLEFQLFRGGGGGGGGSRDNLDKGSIVAEEFFETLELQGINWVAGTPLERLSSSGSFEKVNPRATRFGGGLPLQYPIKCQFTSNFSAGTRMKVVAYRGYLRPDITKRSIVFAEKAKSYFSALQENNKKSDHHDDGTSDFSNSNRNRTKNLLSLYDLTPYSRYWEYYKTPLMVGNVYLWSERGTDKDNKNIVATLHRFRWHSGSIINNLGLQNQNSRVFEEELCEDSEDEVEIHDNTVFERLTRAGRMVDVVGSGGDGSTCEKKDDAQLLLGLPLGKEPALRLAAFHLNQ